MERLQKVIAASGFCSRRKAEEYIKSGKVYYALKDIKYFKKGEISKSLEKLYALDKKIKHNEVDRFYNFELFILNF